MTQSDQSECRWCGAPATHQREARPERISPKTQEILEPGIYVSVCGEHNAMFDREEQRADLRKQIARLESARLRRRPFNPATLEEARRRLRELDTWEPMGRTG